MSTLAAGVYTQADAQKELNPDGSVATPIQLLSQMNELFAEAEVMAGNLPAGQRTTVQTALPTISSRILNQGVTPGKDTTAQIEDSVGLYEAYYAIDKKIVDRQPNPTQYRLNRNNAYREAFAQKIAQQTFYGNAATTPSDFTGLGPRYNSLSGNIGNQVIAANATNAVSGSDQTSMWYVRWAPDTIALVHGKNGKAGYQEADRGEIDWQTSTTFGAATSAFRAYVTWFEWEVGLAVMDYRYAVRIANIDTSAAVGLSGQQASTTAEYLPNLMVRAYHKVPNNSKGRGAWYCNRSIGTALHLMALQKATYQLTVENFDGKPVTSFLGQPIRIIDQITTAAETVVS